MISDPANSGTPGVAFLKYSSGNFQFVGTVEGNEAVEDLNGHGQLLDLAEEWCF